MRMTLVTLPPAGFIFRSGIVLSSCLWGLLSTQRGSPTSFHRRSRTFDRRPAHDMQPDNERFPDTRVLHPWLTQPSLLTAFTGGPFHLRLLPPTPVATRRALD